MLDIKRQLLPEFIEAADLRLVEKLLPQHSPEPFYFYIGLRIEGAADRMFDLVVAQIGPELVVPGPADELPAAVGQDFFRERVVAARLFSTDRWYFQPSDDEIDPEKPHNANNHQDSR